MQPSVRRAGAFALVATLALAAPVAGVLAAVPFALIAVVGRTVTEGPIFELFARPEDRLVGELRGLVEFSLAVMALALLSALAGLPYAVFVASVLLLGYGNLVEQVVRERRDEDIARVVAFSLGAVTAAIGGQAAVAAIEGTPMHVPTAAFLAISGALLAALVRAVVGDGGDALVMFSVALALWLFADVQVMVDPIGLALAVGIAGVSGYLSWALGTASMTGMLTGVLMALLTIVLGGFGWFAVLLSFFGIGGLATKFRYEEKREYGVAEDDEGARGGRNVLANSAVALAAVVGYAASVRLAVPQEVFLFAFAGSIATAMSDTLSSEIGVLFGDPHLVTTGERVTVGTDGGVTVEGSAAGVVGAGLVAAIAALALDMTLLGATAVAAAGVLGMFVDSLLGATIEGHWVGNQGVNLLATLAGGVLGGAAVAIV